MAAGDTFVQLAPCNASSSNQQFRYDRDTLQVFNPYKDSLCWDAYSDLGLTMQSCGIGDQHQHFVYEPGTGPMRLPDRQRCLERGEGRVGSVITVRPCNASALSQTFQVATDAAQLTPPPGVCSFTFKRCAALIVQECKCGKHGGWCQAWHVMELGSYLACDDCVHSMGPAAWLESKAGWCPSTIDVIMLIGAPPPAGLQN